MTRLVFAGILLLFAYPVNAQQPTAGRFSALEGVVIDSLRGGFATGASVSVIGTRRFAFTDAVGRFRIDSIPAGEHRLELLHATLDTLGVRVRTEPMAFTSDSLALLALAIPSARTIVRAKCPGFADDAGALIGAVFDADIDEAIVGADVRVWWIQMTIGRDVGVRYEPQQRTATTDESGRYKFCGLPAELTANISSAWGGDSTSTLPLAYGPPGLGQAILYLPGSRAGASPAVVDGATVRGRVLDSAGAPLLGARVALGSDPRGTMTDFAGSFTLSGQRSGTQALTVRKLGYQPEEVILHVTRREPSEVSVRLATYVPVLEAVLVQARRNAALERVGFAHRQQSGMGRYMTPEQVARRHAFTFSDLLVMMPAARGGGLSDPCTTYWVDGNKWFGDVEDMIAPREVGAIEVYSGAFIPAEFQSFEGACRVVVIWTKWKLGTR